MFKKILLYLLISFLFCQCYSKRWRSVPARTGIQSKGNLLLVHAKGNDFALTGSRIHEDFISGYIVPVN